LVKKFENLIINHAVDNFLKFLDRNILSKSKLTPLHVLIKSANENDIIETLNFLILNAKADINAQCESGLTPLHYAVLKNKFKAVNMLIQFTAININVIFVLKIQITVII
jgi:ankyrin repeat protein